MAVPNDHLGAAIFLASPASDFITAHTLYVDGGLTGSGLTGGRGRASRRGQGKPAGQARRAGAERTRSSRL